MLRWRKLELALPRGEDLGRGIIGTARRLGGNGPEPDKGAAACILIVRAEDPCAAAFPDSVSLIQEADPGSLNIQPVPEEFHSKETMSSNSSKKSFTSLSVGFGQCCEISSKGLPSCTST
mmetsp:Transcript_21933/g.51284  ORF Transcript_21933/g.51284 Transcript_21933/m.51284 type:complete len:120 (-) Transcript_21933:397-756(-)